MSHQTFKVCILVDSNIENFYIKHYIDQINPVFNRFKNQVFTRNPSVNSPNLKIYWIDAENDQILVACEEDFRLFLEEGHGRKIFFSVNNAQQQNEEEEFVQMEAENAEQSPQDGRKSRKSHKEDEKRCRRFEKLSKKLKHYEEACKSEETRSSCRNRNNERLERAKRRVEQIRTIIGSIDPANLNSSSNTNANNESNNAEPTPSTSSSNESVPLIQSPISPETIRLLSNAIAGCLQPCNVINKVLNEVFAIIPQVMEQTEAVASNINVDQQQQTSEVPKNSTATNTSDANTPTIPVRQANQEIEELFKEAAKELEKMNEIVKNNKMESSTTSIATTGSSSQLTQIERTFPNISDSAISDITIVENLNESHVSVDQADTAATVEKSHESSTPPKSMRSRESSIEIHDVNSVMSDDSRDWTILSQDELSFEPVRNADPKTGAIPKTSKFASVDATSQADIDVEIQISDAKSDSIKSVSIETQTPSSLFLSGFPNQEQLQASVQKSIDIVQKSIESIHKSMEPTPTTSTQKQETEEAAASVAAAVVPEKIDTPQQPAPRRDIYPVLKPTAPIMPEQSQANKNASKMAQPKQKFEPAVVVYDPNPKINAAVHTMMQMGFSNEDNWLTQLLINVDGDIAKALNFLTPQPKNRKP